MALLCNKLHTNYIITEKVSSLSNKFFFSYLQLSEKNNPAKFQSYRTHNMENIGTKRRDGDRKSIIGFLR